MENKDNAPLVKVPVLSVVRVVMTGEGLGVVTVDGGVMIMVTGWPDTVVVSVFTKLPDIVVLSTARRVSGVMVIERMVPVFVVGTTMVKVEEAGAEIMLPSDARAYMA